MKDILFSEHLKKIEQFLKERDWQVYHYPKNIALSIVDEAGELAEHFIDIETSGWNLKKREAVAHEMADVLAGILSLCLFFNLDPDTDLPAPTNPSSIHHESQNLQTLVLKLSVETAKLIKFIIWISDEDSKRISCSGPLKETIASSLHALVQLASVLSIDLIAAAEEKYLLREQKYPPNLTKGDISRYFARKHRWQNQVD